MTLFFQIPVKRSLGNIQGIADKWKLYYSFLYYTGLRAGDVSRLKYSNIDRDKKAIISLVRKSRRVHQLPLADELLKLIPNK